MFLKSISLPLLIVLGSQVSFMSCTSTSDAKKVQDPVSGSGVGADGKPVDPNLPDELKDAESFDPAAHLDANGPSAGDFNEVKKEIESTKASLDAEWKAQEDRENAIKLKKDEEKKKREMEIKAEEQKQEEARLKSIKEYEKTSKMRVQWEEEAQKQVAKMPTISDKDLMWSGLEE